MRIQYKIEFLDYWHLSSGLSAGTKLDASVLKDEDGIPFAAGKTIKGLAREMAELLEDEPFVEKCFGSSGVNMGTCYFSNASVLVGVKEQIITNSLQENLYAEIASTKIENGMAVNHSLRETEVVIPITLYGEIDNVPQVYEEQMTKSLKMIKRMGLNRNRGLGRCSIKMEGWQ